MKPAPRLEPGMTIEEAQRALAAAFENAGLDEARADARRLVETATGLTREAVLLLPSRRLSPGEVSTVADFTRRRLLREPVSRIEGCREFYGRSFRVTPDTLDPRPDTETLVDLALDLLLRERTSAGVSRPLVILDIGTGTGCILLSLIAELTDRGVRTTGVGLDASPRALEVAASNAVMLGLRESVSWRLVEGASWAEPDPHPDIVVSNPPYIPSSDIDGLDAEVRDHDPRLALDGGSDGLDILRRLVSWSAGRTGTWFTVEVDAGQAPDVVELVRRACGDTVARTAELRTDLGGHTRCVAWKPQF